MSHDDPIPSFLRGGPAQPEPAERPDPMWKLKNAAAIVGGAAIGTLVLVAGVGFLKTGAQVIKEEAAPPAVASSPQPSPSPPARVALFDPPPPPSMLLQSVPIIIETPAPVQPQPRRTEEDVARRVALGMIREGMDALREGKVPAARMAFEMALKEGEPFAAVGMAQSYDPVVNRMYRTGWKGDAARSKTWYDKSEVLFEARRLHKAESAR